MKKFLSILFTLVLFLSLAACNFENILGGNNDNTGDQTGDQPGGNGGTGDTTQNEKEFKDFLASNKFISMDELDAAYSEMVSNIELPDDLFSENTILVNTKAAVTIPYSVEENRTADFYLYQKENMIYFAGVPRGFEGESISAYLDLDEVETMYDDLMEHSDFAEIKEMKLSEIIASLIDESGAEMPFDYDDITSLMTFTADDFTVVEYGKFQLKNSVLFDKIASLDSSMTAKDIENVFAENDVDINAYVYFSDNLLKGIEVVYNIKYDDEVMTASCKYQLTYTDNALTGILVNLFATNELDATISLQSNNDEITYIVDVLTPENMDYYLQLKASEKGITINADMNDIDGEVSVSLDAALTPNSIDYSVKMNDVEMMKCDIDFTITKIAGFDALSIDGSISVNQGEGFETMTIDFESGQGVTIPESVFDLEADAENLIELISEGMGGTGQAVWVREYHFMSYYSSDGVSFVVGETYQGQYITSDYMYLYIDGTGTGKLYWEGFDSIEFHFNVEYFEEYGIVAVQFMDENYSESGGNLVQYSDGRVCLEITVSKNGVYVCTQAITFEYMY